MVVTQTQAKTQSENRQTNEWTQPTAVCSLLMQSIISIYTSGQRAGLRHRRAWVQITAVTLSGNTLKQTVHTHRASVHQAAKMVAALLRVVRATAGLAESNGSLPPGLWLTSPAGWLPRTGISSRTTRSVIEYGLPLPLHAQNGGCLYLFLGDLCRYSGPVTADRLIVVQLDSDNATLATLDFTKLNHVTGDMQVRHSHTGTQPHIDQRPANHLHQQ